MMRRLSGVVAGLALLVAGLGGPADAKPGWTPTGTLSTGASASGMLSMKVNARGDGVLAYTPDYDTLWVSTRRSGKPWSKPRKLATGPSVTRPQVGIAADGRSILVWEESATTFGWLRATTFSAAGSQGAVRNLTSPTGTATDPSLAVNPSGKVAVAWKEGTPNRAFGTSGPIGAALPPGVPLDGGTATGTYRPNAAVDHAGNVVFAWESDFPNRFEVQTRVHPAGGSLQPVTVLAGGNPDARAEFPHLSVTPQGEAVVVYGFRPTSGADQEIWYSVRRGGAGGFGAGTWSLPDRASMAGQVTDSPGTVVAATGPGAAVITYTIGGRLWTASRNGAGFTGHQPLTAPGETAYASTRLSSRGGLTVLAWEGVTTTSSARVALRPRGGVFGATRTIASGVNLNAVGADVDDQGNAYVVDLEQRCPPGCTQATFALRHLAYDAASPTIGKVRKPKKSKAGKKAKFSVVASDRVSAIKVVWRFGDGKKATGLKVRHQYAKAGKKKVKVVVTDALGNRTVKKVTVKVKAAPGG